MTDAVFYHLASRALVRLTGDEATPLLDDIVTADISSLPQGEVRMGALLTPQGRIMFDMLFSRDDDSLLIEVDAARREQLISRLKLYRMRRKVDISNDDRTVYAITGSAAGMRADRRFPEQTGRFYGVAENPLNEEVFTRLRWQHGIFEGSAELPPEKALPLEARLDLDDGISFEKGCYIGQEVTARTRYRGLVKKSCVPVKLSASVSTPVRITADGKDAGDLLTLMDDADGAIGVAVIRLAMLTEDAPALHTDDGALVTPQLPPRLLPLPGTRTDNRIDTAAED